ncbi:hypothetical protein BaRGS_00032627 [Batillaria attramentaria]|uniref:Uncharacterized protein n=1 Tax=Batillaria attramentaria TaxID=370345 RepID=A0ABD0JMC1_9CAEN
MKSLLRSHYQQPTTTAHCAKAGSDHFLHVFRTSPTGLLTVLNARITPAGSLNYRPDTRTHAAEAVFRVRGTPRTLDLLIGSRKHTLGVLTLLHSSPESSQCSPVGAVTETSGGKGSSFTG